MILFPKNHIILSKLVFQKFFDRKNWLRFGSGSGLARIQNTDGFGLNRFGPVFRLDVRLVILLYHNLAFFHLLGLENEQVILIGIKDRVTTDIYWNKAAFGFSLKPVYKKRNYDFDIFMTDNPFLKWASYPYGTITESVINLVRLRLYFMNNFASQSATIILRVVRILTAVNFKPSNWLIIDRWLNHVLGSNLISSNWPIIDAPFDILYLAFSSENQNFL